MKMNRAIWMAVGVAAVMIAGALLYGYSLSGHSPTPATREKSAGDSRKEPGGEKREVVSTGQAGEVPGGEKPIRLSEAERKQFGIQVAAVGPGNLKTHLILSGEVTINADRMAHVVPRLSGVVREVRKNLGDSVKQGEVIAVIESRELADAKAEYLASVERAALARAKYGREERLWRKKISAEQEYLDARQAFAEARITVRSAEQKLHALGFSDAYLKQLPGHQDQSFTRYEIVAPFNATVVKKHITPGEALGADADVFLIADLSTVWVNLNVYEKDLGVIRQGLPVMVSTQRDAQETKAAISYVSPIVQEETRTALARIVLPNARGFWRPGMFVTAKVLVDNLPVSILLPKSALQKLEDKTVVFVESSEGFVPRPVTLGRTNHTRVEITGGLAPGERCVTEGAFTLKAQLSKGSFGADAD